MYHILVVDDELVQLNGLSLDIDWSDLEIEHVFRAQSGELALEIMGNHRVDVIITDISMPGISGLTLTQRITALWPYCKVILISGYSSFEYAQKAISYGVFHYVTKPVDYDELKGIVGDALKKIEEEIVGLSNVKRAEEQYKKALPFIRERYLADWIVRKDGENFIARMEGLTEGFTLDSHAFLIFLNMTKDSAFPLGEVERLSIRALFEGMIFKDIRHLSFETPDRNCVYIAYAPSNEPLVKLRSYLSQMTELVQNNCRCQYGIQLSVFWDTAGGTGRELQQRYASMAAYLSQRLLWNSGLALPIADTLGVCVDTALEEFQKSPYLETLIEAHKLEDSLEKIQRFFAAVKSEPHLHDRGALQVYYIVCNTIVSACSQRDIDMDACFKADAEGFYSFFYFKNTNQLAGWCQRVIRNYIVSDKDHQEINNKGLVRAAQKIVHAELLENLSAAYIADRIHIHPNYLSRLFKTVVGSSLMNYIIHCRVEKAKEWLCLPGCKVADVAERLGYESTAHFGTIFKRETGLSPKEYQKKYFHL